MRFAPAVALPVRIRSHFEAQDVLENGGEALRQQIDGWLNRALVAAGGTTVKGLSIGAQTPLILRGGAPVSSWAPGGAGARRRPHRRPAAGPLCRGPAAGPEPGARPGDRGAGRNGRRPAGASQRCPGPWAQAVARLMSGPDGADVVAVSLDGWDTHAGQKAQLQNRLTGLDQLVMGLKTGLGDAWSRTGPGGRHRVRPHRPRQRHARDRPRHRLVPVAGGRGGQARRSHRRLGPPWPKTACSRTVTWPRPWTSGRCSRGCCAITWVWTAPPWTTASSPAARPRPRRRPASSDDRSSAASCFPRPSDASGRHHLGPGPVRRRRVAIPAADPLGNRTAVNRTVGRGSSRCKPDMTLIASARRQWLANPRRDLLAGTVVALALIPEAIAFSLIAGVDPAVGLYASVVIAVTIAFVGGRPAMISAATGAMALLMVTLVRDHGIEYLFAASILCGGVPDRHRPVETGPLHPVRQPQRDDRLRQFAGHPDLPGPDARTDRQGLDHLRPGRGGPGRPSTVFLASRKPSPRPWSPSSSSAPWSWR